MKSIVRPYEQQFLWNLDWNLIRTFTVVVEQGGISKAAEFLSVSQPTVSHALKRLESTVGRSLLDRRPGHFALTPAGEALYREGTGVLGIISRIPSFITAAESRVAGSISIALVSNVNSAHFDGVLARFAALYPEVRLSISVTDSHEVISRVRQGQATVGVCLIGGASGGIESDILFRERFGLYCGSAHPLFSAEEVTLDSLVGEHSLSFQTESEEGPLFSVRRLRESVGLRSEPRAVSAHLGEVRRLIIAGLGIGALPLHVAQDDVASGRLRQLPPFDELPQIDVHFVTKQHRILDPAEQIFVDMMRQMILETPLAERTYPPPAGDGRPHGR